MRGRCMVSRLVILATLVWVALSAPATARLYWGNAYADTISAANLDASGARNLVSTVGNAYGVAVDAGISTGSTPTRSGARTWTGPESIRPSSPARGRRWTSPSTAGTSTGATALTARSGARTSTGPESISTSSPGPMVSRASPSTPSTSTGAMPGTPRSPARTWTGPTSTRRSSPVRAEPSPTDWRSTPSTSTGATARASAAPTWTAAPPIPTSSPEPAARSVWPSTAPTSIGRILARDPERTGVSGGRTSTVPGCRPASSQACTARPGSPSTPRRGTARRAGGRVRPARTSRWGRSSRGAALARSPAIAPPPRTPSASTASISRPPAGDTWPSTRRRARSWSAVTARSPWAG